MRYAKNVQKSEGFIEFNNLCGGINTAEAPTMISNDQTSDILNFRRKNGVLCTRPAFLKHTDCTADGEYEIRKTSAVSDTGEPIFAAIKTTSGAVSIFLCQKGENGKLYNAVSGSPLNGSSAKINFVGASLTVIGLNVISHLKKYIVFVKMSDGQGGVYKSANGSISAIADTEMYIPTVLASATACDGYFAEFEGTINENFNALTPYYRCVYSSYNLNNPYDFLDNDGFRYTFMTYALPVPLVAGLPVTVKHTLKNGTVAIHTLVYDGEFNCEETVAKEDGLKLRIINNHICFYDGVVQGTVNSTQYRKDNIEVIATYDNTAAKNKMLECNMACWFGGASSGVLSGTRCFISGNKDYPADVFYSAVNEPLYFSEKFYETVGEASDKITAMAKQGKNLVIFKERGIFSLDYSTDTSITADDVISGRISDLSVAIAYFPIVSLNSGVGCDCPDTVVLCRNKLVWLNSDGAVYTLGLSDAYSTANVYELSLMISAKLKTHTKSELRSSSATEWDNSYVLCIGNEAYVLDYGSYAFTHVYSYSDETKAQKNMSWYYWELPARADKVFSSEGKLFILDTSSDKLNLFLSSEETGADAVSDTSENIKVMLKTKTVNPSDKRAEKRIGKLYFTAGAEKDTRIFMSVIDVSGKTAAEKSFTLLGGENTATVSSDVFINLGTAFGIRLNAEGGISVESIGADYKLLRSVR